MGSSFRAATAFTWCLLIASGCFPSTTSAARFEVRNAICSCQGRNQSLTIDCWSANDKLGKHILNPGQTKSWSFTPIFIKIPFLYTYFECTFYTAFGSPAGQTATVFAGERSFRWQCDNPNEEECIWVVKKEGLFLRKLTRDVHGKKHHGDELTMPWIGGTNYHPIQ
ncbi:putative S-protein3 [Cardamine amara subsp. amara]|uniref:S-protein homolog n=1 Tax=Cardamine amara subsp. amara TaxID=228776 RepID=A0ABD1BGB3_CARAN